MSSQQPSGSSSLPRLGPTWRGNPGGRGFQPPPPAENRRSRSESYSSAGSADGSLKQKNVNKFALLDEDEDIMIHGDTEDSKRFQTVIRSTPNKMGRSLADLAARAPEGAAGAKPTAKPTMIHTESKDETKIIRITREKILALRPRPIPNAEPPECLLHLEGCPIISKEPLDPGKANTR
jgi:hypothetical protein